MADVNVPIRFEIYKGDQPVREEILAQDVIKIGKLASSHLRLDDETVSRMHAVIETTGPERDPCGGPRFNPGHDRQRRANHQGAAAVGRRGHVRRLPRGRDLHGGRGRSGNAASAGCLGWSSGRWVRAAAHGSLRASSAAAGLRAAAGSGVPAAGVRTAAVLLRGPGRWRRGRGARRFAGHGGPDGLPRCRDRHPPPLQPRGEVDARSGNVDDVREAFWPSSSLWRPSSPSPSTSAPRRSSTRPGRRPARNRSPSSGRTARRCSRSSFSAASWPASSCRTWGSSGAARRPRTS